MKINKSLPVVAGAMAFSLLVSLAAFAPLQPGRRRVNRAGGNPEDPGYFEDIAADPAASPSEVEQLANILPEAALLHPNCPRELWWELAEKMPLVALQSVTFSLRALEDPEKWDDLERNNAQQWTENWINEKGEDNVQVWRFLAKIADEAADILHDWSPYAYDEETGEDIDSVVDILKSGKVNPVNRRKLAALRKKFSKLIDSAPYMYENSPGDEEIVKKTAFVFTSSASRNAYAINNYVILRTYIDMERFLRSIDSETGDPFYDEEGMELRSRTEEEDEMEENYSYENAVAVWRKLVQFLGLTNYAFVMSQVKLGYLTKFREAFYGPEADREAEVQAKIKKANAQIERSTKEIVEILNRPETSDWPTWVTLGLVATGVALVIFAPELFVIEGVFAAETGTLTTAAHVAHKIAVMARTAEISEATIALGAAAKSMTPEQSQFLKELAVKLAQEGVKVVSQADVITKIVR